MSAKSRGCPILRYLVLQQLVLVTDILGQARPPPRPGRPPGSPGSPGPPGGSVPFHAHMGNPPYPKYLNPYHTPPPYSRYRGGTASPFNHKNSLNPSSSPSIPEFSNHKANNVKYRQPPSRRPPSPRPAINYFKPPPRGQEKYAPYPQTSRPEQLHEYQQNYYKLQQSQKQFFNQPIKQLYEQQQEQLAYHKQQLRLEEQHAQQSEQVFSRVRYPHEKRVSGYIVTPHPENYDPFTSLSTSDYTLNFDRNPFKIGGTDADTPSFRGQTPSFQGHTPYYLDTQTEKYSFDSYPANLSDVTQERPTHLTPDLASDRPTHFLTSDITSDQLRQFNRLKTSTPPGKPTGNRTISTNISLLSNNIDSKHKHLIKFVRNQAGGFKSRTGDDDPGGSEPPNRRADHNYFPDRTTRFTTSFAPGNIFSVPTSKQTTAVTFSAGSSLTHEDPLVSNRGTTSRYPLRRTYGQPFSSPDQKSPLYPPLTPTGARPQGFSGEGPRVVRGSHLNNVTHLIGVSLNDTDAPSAEALHYYGRLSDDEDREELYRMLQNVTLLSDIRKQILDSVHTHMNDGIDAEYPDVYPEATEEEDDAFVFASAPRPRPDKYPRFRPPSTDYSPEIMIHSDLMTEYEKSRPHSANLVEITSTHRDCRLRSRRYISDGQCTSPQPITEAVCADSCTMPSYMFNELPPEPEDEYLDEPPPSRSVQYAGWLRRKNTKRRARAATEKPDKSDRQDYIEDLEISESGPKPSSKWACDAGEQGKKRINLLCNDGSLRQYSLKIIVSCRCRKATGHGHSFGSYASASGYPPSYFTGPGDLEPSVSMGTVPVKTIIKPVPVPVYPPVGPRGKRRWKKRKYKSKRGHHHHHRYPNHKHKHKHHRGHGHHHHHHGHGHHHGKKHHNHKGFRPLPKYKWDHIRKKLRKVVKKQRFKTGVRKSFGAQSPLNDRPGKGKGQKADRRVDGPQDRVPTLV